jgi:hypothetical protein
MGDLASIQSQGEKCFTRVKYSTVVRHLYFVQAMYEIKHSVEYAKISGKMSDIHCFIHCLGMQYSAIPDNSSVFKVSCASELDLKPIIL